MPALPAPPPAFMPPALALAPAVPPAFVPPVALVPPPAPAVLVVAAAPPASSPPVPVVAAPPELGLFEVPALAVEAPPFAFALAPFSPAPELPQAVSHTHWASAYDAIFRRWLLCMILFLLGCTPRRVAPLPTPGT